MSDTFTKSLRSFHRSEEKDKHREIHQTKTLKNPPLLSRNSVTNQPEIKSMQDEVSFWKAKAEELERCLVTATSQKNSPNTLKEASRRNSKRQSMESESNKHCNKLILYYLINLSCVLPDLAPTLICSQDLALHNSARAPQLHICMQVSLRARSTTRDQAPQLETRC